MPLSRDIVDRTLASSYGEAAYRIVEALTDAGFDAWWVGGGVRDMLLGHLPLDIDVATSALPREMLALWPDADASAAALGSFRVRGGAHVFEATTFREDDEASDGRHPESVVFGDRAHDARRRDFTVNALYFQPITRELFDPYGGEEDLKERLIRFIGDPGPRIRHDVLRMLRAVRFRALLDGQYHPETYAALRELAHMISSLSGQRMLGEFERMLKGPRPGRALEDLWELRLLEEFLPELAACKGVPQPADYHREGDVWEHVLACTKAFRTEDSADVRLATVFHDSGKTATFSLKDRIRFNEHASVSADLARSALVRLQCPGRRIEKIGWLIAHHMMMGAFFDMSEERKGHWYYHPWFAELLRLFELDIAGTDPADYTLYNKIVQDCHAFLDRHPRPEKSLLSGDDVMGILGVKPGERVGEVLTLLHDAQIRKEVTTKREAKAFVEKLRK